MKQKYLVCLFKTKISRGNISFKKKKRKVRIGAQDLVGMISRRKLRKLCVFFENNLIEKRMRHLIYDIKFYQISHPKEKVSTCIFFFFFSTFGPFTFFCSQILLSHKPVISQQSLFCQSLIALGMWLIMQGPFYRNMPKYSTLFWALAVKKVEES